MMKTINTI